MNEYTTIELADMILQEKTEKIKPENIRHNIQVFDIIGTYKGDTGASYAPANIPAFTGVGLNTTNDSTLTSTSYPYTNLDIFDVEHLNTGNAKRLYYTFYHCSNLTTLRGLTNWDTSNVTHMRNTFGGMYNITSLEELRNWNTNNVTYMCDIFKYMNNVNLEPLINWDMNNMQIINYMHGSRHYDLSLFADRNYTNIIVNKLLSFNHQINLDNMYNCNFYNCILNMPFMFGNVKSMPEISTWYFDNCNICNLCYYQPKDFKPEFTMNGKNMNLYFMWGSQNTSQYIPNIISTGNYNIDGISAPYMFANASKINTVENITFTHAQDLSYMFNNCSNIVSINNMHVSFETNNGYGDSYRLGQMSSMFYRCINLRDITCIENWQYIDNVSTGDTTPVELRYMFYGCNNLSNESLYAICNFFYNIRPYMNNTAQRNLLNNCSNGPFYGSNINLRNVLDEDMITKMNTRGFIL